MASMRSVTLTALVTIIGIEASPQTAEAKKPVYVAAADEPDPDFEVAKRHFKKGQALYVSAEHNPKLYPDALAEFLEAFRLQPAKTALIFNIARCYDRMEKWEMALEWYRRYSLDGPREDIDGIKKSIDRAAVLAKRVEEERAKSAPAPTPTTLPVTPPPPAPAPSPPTHPSVADQAIAFGPPPPAPPAKSRKWLYAAIGTGAAAILAAGIGGGLVQNGLDMHNDLVANCHYTSCIEPTNSTAKSRFYGGEAAIGLSLTLAVIDVPLIIRAVREAREQSNPQPPAKGTR